MKILFAVVRTPGRAWDPAREMRAQAQWPEHAAFMNGLARRGFVFLGGPIGGAHDALLAVAAGDEAEVRAVLAQDPWSVAGILTIKSVERWTILLDSSAPD